MTLASHNSIDQNPTELWINLLNEFVQNNTHHFMNFINFISLADDTIENDPHLLLRHHNYDEVTGPYFIDLSLELSQFTSWCIKEHDPNNSITKIAKSIIRNQQKKHQEDRLNNSRRRNRPQPWLYGDEYSTDCGYVYSPSSIAPDE